MNDTIRNLVERKTTQLEILSAILSANVFGKKHEELVDLNLKEIEARKELASIEAQINDYINGGVR